MASVIYNKTVSDQHLHVVLQRLADVWGKTVTVHSGDRDSVVKGSNPNSLHILKRAADFHVAGMSDTEVFNGLRQHMADVFDPNEGYELIQHGPHTGTGGPHVHLGHYPGTHKGEVQFKLEGMAPGTADQYTVTTVPIGNGHPVETPRPRGATTQISGSVGDGGSNLGADVTLAQHLLNVSQSKLAKAKFPVGHYGRLAEDGLYGPKTREAIRIFQKDVAGLSSPDGIIDPGGKTMRVLQAVAHGDVPRLKTQVHHARTHGASPDTTSASVAALSADNRVKAMLDVLAFTEGTGTDYGKIVNGTVISSPFYPDLVGKTNVSVTNLSRHPDILVRLNATLQSTAAGRYQFLKSTWDGLRMPDFSATSQDQAAIQLMQRRGMIAPLMAGNLREAVSKGAQEWASLPTASGGSFYGGQPARTFSEIEAKYQEALAKYAKK